MGMRQNHEGHEEHEEEFAISRNWCNVRIEKWRTTEDAESTETRWISEEEVTAGRATDAFGRVMN
jgi:hypothetical protein